MKNCLYQFIPRRFEYLTKDKKVSYNGKILKTDYIINLIHEFIIKYYFSNDIQSLKVNLYSLILRKKYGMNYNYYINYLIDKNFIKMTSNYFVGKKAKTYQINYFDVGELMRVRIYDKILLTKYSKNYLENSITEYNNSSISIDIRRKLVKDIYSVTIDYDKSLKYLDDLKEKKLINNNKYFKNYISINGIKDNHLFFKFDSYGRFHTNFTILKRHIRQNYLKISGDNVCEIDIKNSQPFFLSYLMKKYKADWTEFEDVEKFFFIVNNGLIYDDIIDRYSNINDRDEAKVMIYKVLFGKNDDFKKTSKIFKELYPNVYKFIENYKEIKGDYKKMSHELQMIESDFIFNNVIKKIIKKVPKIKLITIHDSIIYPCSYDKIVKEIFNTELNKMKNYQI